MTEGTISGVAVRAAGKSTTRHDLIVAGKSLRVAREHRVQLSSLAAMQCGRVLANETPFRSPLSNSRTGYLGSRIVSPNCFSELAKHGSRDGLHVSQG